MQSLTQLMTLGAAMLALATSSLCAQTRTGAAQPLFKGIFEPVSYTEDLDLTDVYFVNAEVGWVSGKSGTILRTINGGKTWEVQLGGDPADRTAPVRSLHFLDERRGWAVQGEGGGAWKMLHTSDGESWEEIGSAPYGADVMAFTSPRTGFATGNPGMAVSGSSVMYRTTDGGRSWKPVWTCQAKIAMGGVTQNFECVFGQIRFPSSQVGYAVARRGCTGCGAPPLIAKTSDGGETWQLMTGPGVLEEDEVSGIFFLDERTGFARLLSKKLHMTTDGGATWRGIVASPGEAIQFADPSVGWGIELGWTDLRMSYTTDGGKRWSSRQMKLPAVTRAFSLPRRDRAYVVGENGMIFRYRVVSASHPIGPNVVVAPPMPGFESPIDEQVEQLETVINEIGKELEAFTPPSGGVAPAGASAPAGSVAAADSVAVWNEPFEAPLPPPSGFTANCCKKSFSHLDVTLAALAPSLTDFIARYKNLNLLLAAIRMGTELPAEYRALKSGLRTFRTAPDKASAQAALADVLANLRALKQTTAVSMQQQLPPPSDGMEEAPTAAVSASSKAAASPKSSVKDSSKTAGKDAAKEAAEKAKKGLGSLLRKKIP